MAVPVTPSALRSAVESDLRGNILPFWLRHVAIPGRRSLHGQLASDLTVNPDAERGALLSARILWTYAAAFRAYGDAAYRDMAALAEHDLVTRFHDAQHGGFFWSIQADGTVHRDRKQVYGQAFAIYALSEWHAATGAREPLERAIATFQLLERHARDPGHGGYLEAFARDWSPVADMRLSPADQNDPKSQNTLLHVMEAYTRLLQVWPDAALRAALWDLVGRMLTRVLDVRTGHLRLFFTADWQPTSDKISYGHDIEAAWLLARAVATLDDAELAARMPAVVLRIADATLAEGMDADGGIFNLGDPGGIVDAGKEWWPQAEAVVGFLEAWRISGAARYFDAAARTWNFIATHLIDRRHGEWHRGVTRDGRVDPAWPKVSFWKCPYHNGRMGLEVRARLRDH